MNNKKNRPSNNLTNRIRSSLVIKLNVRMMGRLLVSFLKMNILIIVFSLFAFIWKAESGAQDIVKTIENSSYISQPIFYNTDYRITNSHSNKGIILPSNIQKYMPLEVENTRRNISIFTSDEKIGLVQRIEQIRYIMEFTLKGSDYQIIYYLGSDLKLLLYLLIIILSFEMLTLIGNIGKGSRMIRRTLKPLSDLTETAKSLNAEVSSMGSKLDDAYIKNLAGEISSIDANKLDKRITIDSSQNELKELASAINDMLNRINSSYKAQVRFVSDASHELRTPISVIQGYVNLLDRWGKEDPKVMQEAIDAIKTEAENMKGLIEQLLFLARSDNETIQLHKECFDSCDIVEEIIHETQMIDSNHIFEMSLDRPAYINADKQLLKQAIRILVDNSIKFTPNGKKIVLKVDKKEENIYITVQDSGIGIDPESLPYIFDRFYRSDESRARETGGSGLGLSIAKWIIDRHGGYFEILSRVDVGTRITIVFPAADIENEERVINN